MADQHILALDLNPLHWLGDAASAALGDAWKSAMTALWSASLWILKLAFTVIDAFTTPDVSASGPMGAVLPTTLWIGATLAVIMMCVQLTLALIRRDGKSLGQVLLGIGQFGLVWVGYLGVAAGLVAAAAGLERAILGQMLHVNTMSGIDLTQTFVAKVDDITLATVLGILGMLIVIPASFFYILIMFVREAALIVLVATAPIAAGGLVSDVGKVWFWKTLRWFFACLLISPMAALLLGIGVKLSAGVINPPPNVGAYCKAHACDVSGQGLQTVSKLAVQSNTAHAGMAVVGCIVIAIGACCPLILFRLLAFVDPGTASGASLRQSWSDAGGMSGVLTGRQTSGSGAAVQSGADGRSAGESDAESQTQSRLSGALGAFGTGMAAVRSVAHRAADLGSDVLGQTGVGSPGYSMTPTDERYARRSPPARASSDGGAAPGGDSGGTGSGDGSPPDPPPPPSPHGGGGPGPGGTPKPPGPGGPGAGAGGAGAAGGSEAAAAAVAL